VLADQRGGSRKGIVQPNTICQIINRKKKLPREAIGAAANTLPSPRSAGSLAIKYAR